MSPQATSLPVTMITAAMVPMRPHHDHAKLPVVVAMVSVVVRTVVRTTDYNLTSDVGISETQRDSHTGLGLSDTGRQPE